MPLPRRILYRLITLLTAFLILLFHPGTWLNRAIAVLTCTIFSASSTICLANFSGSAIAAQPETPTFTSSVKQLDADHAEIRLTFPKGCEFVSHLTKTPKGIIQDSLQYRHDNLEACGIKPFTIHYANAGKTIDVQIQGQTDRLRLEASANKGTIQQTYQAASGKVYQENIPIPKEILDYLKESEKKSLVEGGSSALPSLRTLQSERVVQQPWLVASNNVEKLDSPAWLVASNNVEKLDSPATPAIASGLGCTLAEKGESICQWIDMITGVTSFAGLFVALPFIPYLGIASLISETICWGLYGGFPPVIGLVTKGAKEILLGKTLDEVNGLIAAANRRKRALGGLLKDNPLFQKYVNDINRLKEAARERLRDPYEVAPNLEAGEAVTGLATALNAYLDKFKDTHILSELIHGQLHDFLDDCKKEKPTGTLIPAISTGDPHLGTFDGLRYDLQTVGEFILTKSNDGAFEVQARQAPLSASLSVNSAIAMKVGRDRVALYAREFPDADTSTPLRVNGEPTSIQDDKLTLTGGGEIVKQGSTYIISAPLGEKVIVNASGSGNLAFFNVSPFVYNQSGRYSGLLGNVNGNPKDDLQIRGGGNISEIRSTYGDVNKALNLVGLRVPGALDAAEKLYFDRLYKDFGNSWRVKQEESLFDYPSGKTTRNYVDPAFPDKYLTLNMLSADQIQKARKACTEANVTQDLMEGCIFDVGFSGLSEFARTAAEINGYIGIVKQLLPINLPQLPPKPVIPKPRVCLPFIGCL